MTAHTFNKENWSGEEATIDFKEDGTFQINGWDIVTTRKEDRSDDDLVFEIVEAFHAEEPDRVIATATKLTWTNKPRLTDKYFTAFDGDISDESLSRLGVTAEVAIARVLFNTL